MQTIISQPTFEKARKQINSAKAPVIFSSEDDDLNRQVLEKLKIDVLLLNQSERKDFQKQRNSGLNHVLGKIAKKNKVAIGINLDEIVNFNSKNKSNILARIKQNVKICNKNKLQMVFVSEKSKRNIYDLKSLGLVLGMPTWMASDFVVEVN